MKPRYSKANTKFLGVTIDESLNWKHYITTLEKAVLKSIGILYNGKPILNVYY